MADACIEFTDTPLPSNNAKDVMDVQEQVYQTPLFQRIIKRVQSGQKTIRPTREADYEKK